MKRTCSALLIAILYLSLVTPTYATGTQMSAWGSVDIGRADRLGLVTDILGTDYTKDITRIQFAELITNFVETVTGSTIEEDGIKFTDTSSLAIQKAAAAGIVKGTGNGTTFSPNCSITREEIAVMLYRTVQYINPNEISTISSFTQFSDATQVSEWAWDAVGSMVGCGIINGISENLLAPTANASIEQAIIFVYRLYKKVITSQIIPLAETYASEQKDMIAKLQASYSTTPSSFSDSRVDSLKMAEVFQKDGNTYILYSLRYSVKADRPEAVVLFDDTMKDGWLSMNAISTLVFQTNCGTFALIGGYITEFSANGNNEVYQADFESWLAERGGDQMQ